MDLWQRNLRIIHQISEFVDLDTHGSDRVSDLIGLIDAMREGLTQIDDQLCIPDAQINMLFLTKLKARPQWADWATTMLQDGRPCAADRLTFRQLADLALRREKETGGDTAGTGHSRRTAGEEVPGKDRPRTLTQEDINAFVVGQMRRSQSVRGHAKRPSQEEINDYVVQQMRRDQETKARARSYSQPEPRIRPAPALGHQGRRPRLRCTFCGDTFHQVDNCWRRWRVAVEAPQGQFVPKRVEFRSEVPGQRPTYHSGFMLY
ncbi:hypothetical protein BDV59DRAFT_170783 [Aspergillus ambiguus]|uniref:uncharacterized protein n=1 Tax=Aspergillus ambiguus TaxID=176160 RepID=UPI003CCDB230